MSLDRFFAIPPYSLNAKSKECELTVLLAELTVHHYNNCAEYRRILDVYQYSPYEVDSTASLPFLPVRLFKMHDLHSVPKENIVKTLTSSGTSGQAVSKIYLDSQNVHSQTKVLNAIISSFIGKKRLPLLLLDTEMIKKDRAMYSARGAGIIGFSIFGRKATYALDTEMQLDMDKIKAFCEEHKDSTVLMFGYTYMIWQFVVLEMEKHDIKFELPNAILFHIGGWKKLKDQAVDPLTFNRRIQERLGNVKVYNYYGMAEQLGSVFVECEYGHMHCSNYSDVIVRRSFDFSVAEKNERGLLELLSVLPTSYPGHAILTEDEGEIFGIDDCPCGRLGKYFKIHGRIKNAELRGCSDTFERR